MSSRYQAGIVLPGYNALKVANAPTIGTATVASGTSVSVTFTAPSCVGGGAISSYRAYCTTTGTNITTGASSPLVVTGLTTGTAYTFRVSAANAFGPSYPSAASNSVTPIAQGQQAYTTAGTYSWVAPAGVTSVSVVAVGSGAAAQFYQPPGSAYYYPGGGGGALAYTNNATVIPGNSYAVVVGAGVCAGVGNGNFSSFACTVTKADGGKNRVGNTGGAGGTVLFGTGGGAGGKGGDSTADASVGCYAGGSGGAGGYSGAGGAGGNASGTTQASGSAGSGGGAGGSASGVTATGDFGSGGVGILGEGSSGAGGTTGGIDGTGKGGSGGALGQRAPARGGAYGGAKASVQGGLSGGGAVRIIWPGTTRFFPSTNTGDV